MKIIFTILGLYLGAITEGFTGALFGGVVGLLAGALINAHGRFRQLEQRLAKLEQSTAPATEDRPPDESPATRTAGR